MVNFLYFEIVFWQNIQTRGAYLNWEFTKAFPKTLIFSNVKYFLIRLSAWSLNDVVWHNFEIRFSKLSLLSIINSSNSKSADSFITFEPINKLYSGGLDLLRVINWNFSGFAFMELILNQVIPSHLFHRHISWFLLNLSENQFCKT